MSEELESKSLPAHVTACGERYKTIFNRLKRIERGLWLGLTGLIGILLWIIRTLLEVGGALMNLSA